MRLSGLTGQTPIGTMAASHNRMITDLKFIALNREAELAKRLTCSGLSALRKATPARPGVYYEAFFGISIGLERLAKLAWLIDECITRSGAQRIET
jgi:hypothetical protein